MRVENPERPPELADLERPNRLDGPPIIGIDSNPDGTISRVSQKAREASRAKRSLPRLTLSTFDQAPTMQQTETQTTTSLAEQNTDLPDTPSLLKRITTNPYAQSAAAAMAIVGGAEGLSHLSGSTSKADAAPSTPPAIVTSTSEASALDPHVVNQSPTTKAPWVSIGEAPIEGHVLPGFSLKKKTLPKDSASDPHAKEILKALEQAEHHKGKADYIDIKQTGANFEIGLVKKGTRYDVAQVGASNKVSVKPAVFTRTEQTPNSTTYDLSYIDPKTKKPKGNPLLRFTFGLTNKFNILLRGKKGSITATADQGITSDNQQLDRLATGVLHLSPSSEVSTPTPTTEPTKPAGPTPTEIPTSTPEQLSANLKSWIENKTPFPDNKRVTGGGNPLNLGYADSARVNQNLTYSTAPHYDGILIDTAIVDNHIIAYMGFEDVDKQKFFVPYNFGTIGDTSRRINALDLQGNDIQSDRTNNLMNLTEVPSLLNSLIGQVILLKPYLNANSIDDGVSSLPPSIKPGVEETNQIIKDQITTADALDNYLWDAKTKSATSLSKLPVIDEELKTFDAHNIPFADIIYIPLKT